MKSITLKFSENEDLLIPAKGITIFVGPNNSGKSLVLKELEAISLNNPFPSGLKIVKEYEIDWPDNNKIEDLLNRYYTPTTQGLPDGHITLGRINPNGGNESSNLSMQSIYHIANNKIEKQWWFSQVMRWGILRLDGRSRFNLTNDQHGGDLLSPPTNVLTHLFVNDDARNRVRKLVKEAFGTYLVIDPTSLGALRIRLSDSPPAEDEQSLNESARRYHSSAQHIKDASDGVQAYSGIVTAVLTGNFDTILIDEPEAFLHPPLARKLGRHLAGLAAERSGTLMASTHSPDFLMGCLQGSAQVRVVRLEYGNGKSRGKLVDQQKLDSFLKRPLMRSANIISGLFHDGVVVTESDNDRTFYAEIYYRMSESMHEMPSILFVNAQNKQTIRQIIGPLREFGVPAVAITDIDIVKEGGKVFQDWLNSSGVPTALRDSFGVQRASIFNALEATGKNMKVDGGIKILPSNDQKAASIFFDTLDTYGVFAVRSGELENWLPNLGVTTKKTEWAVDMLERMGSDPNHPEYVNPANDDVWEFMSRIVAWVKNPARIGM